MPCRLSRPCVTVNFTYIASYCVQKVVGHVVCLKRIITNTAKILDIFLQINAHALTVNTRSSFLPWVRGY